MPPQQTQSTASLMMNQLAEYRQQARWPRWPVVGLGLKNPNDIYIGLLNSRPVADAIIHRFGLATLYRAKDMTAARKKLADETVVASEKNGFIAVSVTDKDKSRAAEMANAYTDELRVLTKTLAVTEASQRRLFYEEQLKQAKDALVAAEVLVPAGSANKGPGSAGCASQSDDRRSGAAPRAGRGQGSGGAGAALVFDGAQSGSWNWQSGNYPPCRERQRAWSSAATLPDLPIWGWGMFRAPAWNICAPSTN